jgi:hypothetical protein
MSDAFLYLAQGKIRLKRPDQAPKDIESKFGLSLIDRANQITNRNAWKTQGTGARFMSGGLLWRSEDDASTPIVIHSVARGTRPGEFFYSLATQEIGGVFCTSTNGTEERRLLHTSDFRIGILSAPSSGDKIACVVRSKAESHIAVMNSDGSDLREVTQGDSNDSAPSWVPGSSREIVFQSSGIGRDASGSVIGMSAARIEKLNLATGEITTLLQDEKYDFLFPRMDASGKLYCIRKPHLSGKNAFDPIRALLDLVLLPFRLLFALFQFMNFFTMRYTGKTLVTSGDVRQKHPDIRQLMMMDNLAQAMRSSELVHHNQKSWKASPSWVLIQHGAPQELKIMEKSVLAFDLLEDGSILLSDGQSIRLRQPDGSSRELLQDQFISQVLAIPAH